jgi:hypothetical protein
MPKKRRKARPPRRPSAVAAPQWLTQLREEVFSDPTFPEVETGY